MPTEYMRVAVYQVMVEAAEQFKNRVPIGKWIAFESKAGQEVHLSPGGELHDQHGRRILHRVLP